MDAAVAAGNTATVHDTATAGNTATVVHDTATAGNTATVHDTANVDTAYRARPPPARQAGRVATVGASRER